LQNIRRLPVHNSAKTWKKLPGEHWSLPTLNHKLYVVATSINSEKPWGLKNRLSSFGTLTTQPVFPELLFMEVAHKRCPHFFHLLPGYHSAVLPAKPSQQALQGFVFSLGNRAARFSISHTINIPAVIHLCVSRMAFSLTRPTVPCSMAKMYSHPNHQIEITMRYLVALALALLLVQPVLAATGQRGLAVRPKAPTGEEVKGDLWLLTIGINSYLSWPQLKTAVNDAQSVKTVLLKRYHLDPSHVIELTDDMATRHNILGAFRNLAKKVKPEDSLLVYYAGHGHIDSITGKGSWIPVESGTDNPEAWISNRDVTDYLNINAIKARHVLMVSDSCFSGDFFRGSRAGLPTIDDAFLKKAYTRSSRQAISSGGLEPVSDAGFGGNSVFSHFLVAALQNNTKTYLIPSELFNEVRAGVSKNADQLPQFGDLHGVGAQDGGELILFLRGDSDSKLQDLSGASAARQKELEQLKKMERDARAATEKEKMEIAKREAELTALDGEIAKMRERLGTSSARTGDSLDSMVAMVEQKEDQEHKLEVLRKQREAEERKRQQEITQLKKQAEEKRSHQIETDLAKYQKVAGSRFGQDMKEAAWRALVAAYPESHEVGSGDVDQFRKVMGLEKLSFAVRNINHATSVSGDSMILNASMGKIKFSHPHNEVKCSSCHAGEPGKIAELSKEWAHKNCKGCHAEMRKGPIACKDCHKR
jgi:hypothetical protein